MTVQIPLDKACTYTSIVACDVCCSTGIQQRSTLTDYHRGDYDYWNALCSFCKGDGRVLEIVQHSIVELQLPNGKTSTRTVESKYQECLNGRTTQDIYTIGKL